MAAAIAIIKTAPAARSFVFFIISLYSGETKSANDSMDELIASADNTAPITITTAIHSVWDKPKKKPAITTQIAAKQCIHALCSFCINKRMPLKAYRKLASRLRKVKPLFFILFRKRTLCSFSDTIVWNMLQIISHISFWHSFCQR